MRKCIENVGQVPFMITFVVQENFSGTQPYEMLVPPRHHIVYDEDQYMPCEESKELIDRFFNIYYLDEDEVEYEEPIEVNWQKEGF